VSSGAQSQWGFTSRLEIWSFGRGHHVSVVSIFRVLLQHLPNEEKALDCHGRDFSFGASLSGFVSSSYAVYCLNYACALTKHENGVRALEDLNVEFVSSSYTD